MNGAEFAALERQRAAGAPVQLPPLPTDPASLQQYGAAVAADDILSRLRTAHQRAQDSPTWHRLGWAGILAMVIWWFERDVRRWEGFDHE